MNFFSRIINWINPSRREEQIPELFDEVHEVKSLCPHGNITEPFEIEILGVMCELRDSPMCLDCTKAHLNKYSTLCASCFRPIFPNTSVGQSYEGSKYPYTHLTFSCCDSGAFYCGVWGEGRLITLHELDSEKYPSGNKSVAEHILGAKPGLVVSTRVGGIEKLIE